MAVQILDKAGTNQAAVDANGALLTATSTVAGRAGFAAVAAEIDDGTVTGTREVTSVRSSSARRLQVGIETPWFNEVFPGSAINTTVWTTTTTTQTVTVASGFLNLNAGLSVATSTYANVRTYRHFPGMVGFGLVFQARVQFAQLPVTGNLCEWGMGLAATNATPTDGAFFRLLADGTFKCIINNGGTELQSDPLSFSTLVGASTTKHFKIEILNGFTYFFIDQTMVAKLANNLGTTTSSMMLPMMFRNINSSATSAAQVMKVGVCSVSTLDMGSERPWPLVAAGQGGHASQGQAGGTLGTTALYANSTNPTAAVPTNTAASLGSGLGGNFWSTATLAVNTDGIVSSYQVPAGTAAVPGKSIVIYGLRISSAVQTVLAGGPFVLQWGLAYGHTSVSLATAEAAATKAPRRKALGFQTLAATAAVGVQATDIVVQFQCPIVVQPGEFVQTIYKNIGTVGTSGTIAHAIDFDAVWE